MDKIEHRNIMKIITKSIDDWCDENNYEYLDLKQLKDHISMELS